MHSATTSDRNKSSAPQTSDRSRGSRFRVENKLLVLKKNNKELC